MSTSTQLNWHQRYLSTVAELHQARLDSDKQQIEYQRVTKKLREEVQQVNAQRDKLAEQAALIGSGLKSLLRELS